MGSKPDISVIIVSRDRPDDLRKMLSCLRFQDITGYEVIVVTNTPGALEGAATPRPIRLFDCDEANIAVARNVGLRAATGRFVAFCDDDALPDPAWLRQLMFPFNDPEIGGTGGFTRGRNGISRQWGAVETDRLGTAHPLDIKADSPPKVFLPAPDKAPVMIGTNCAFRKSALQQVGGFDPAFAYYLDDSDISLRLSQAGWRLAIVPRAEVHHGFASGPYRRHNRVPKTLEPHGKSHAVFCRKHAAEAALAPAMAAFRALQFKRLEKQMLAGLLPPPTLTYLIKTLDKGANTGRHMLLTPAQTRPRPAAEPAPVFSPAPRPHVMLVGRRSNLDWLGRLGKKLSKGGIPVTALILSRTPAFMQVSFSGHGYWQHNGGQFGKSARTEPLWQNHSLKTKARAEAARLRAIRPVDLLVYPDKAAAGDIILPQTGEMSCINGFVVESV